MWGDSRYLSIYVRGCVYICSYVCGICIHLYMCVEAMHLCVSVCVWGGRGTHTPFKPGNVRICIFYAYVCASIYVQYLPIANKKRSFSKSTERILHSLVFSQIISQLSISQKTSIRAKRIEVALKSCLTHQRMFYGT